MITLLVNHVLRCKKRIKDIFPTLLTAPMLITFWSSVSVSNAAESAPEPSGNKVSEQHPMDKYPNKIECGDAGTFILRPTSNTIALPNWQNSGKSKIIRALLNEHKKPLAGTWIIRNPKIGETVYSYSVEERNLYYNIVQEQHGGHKVFCKQYY